MQQAETRIENHPCIQHVGDLYNWKRVLDMLPPRGSITPYSKIPSEVDAVLSRIKTRYGMKAYHTFNRWLLVKAMSQTADSAVLREMPARLFAEWETWCHRVLSDLDQASEASFSFQNDFFLKDLAVCRLKMIPAVSNVLEMLGLARRVMFRGNVKQFIRMSLLVWTGNVKPYFQTHMDLRYLNDFNPSGRTQCFLAASEFLSRTPEVKGLFSSSWYNDPALDDISPHLSYLRRIPLENGAVLFRVGSSEQDVNNATMKSKTRKRLYEAGQYVPTCYMWVWPRARLMRWASAQNPSQESIALHA